MNIHQYCRNFIASIANTQLRQFPLDDPPDFGGNATDFSASTSAQFFLNSLCFSSAEKAGYQARHAPALDALLSQTETQANQGFEKLIQNYFQLSRVISWCWLPIADENAGLRLANRFIAKIDDALKNVPRPHRERLILASRPVCLTIASILPEKPQKLGPEANRSLREILQTVSLWPQSDVGLCVRVSFAALVVAASGQDEFTDLVIEGRFAAEQFADQRDLGDYFYRWLCEHGPMCAFPKGPPGVAHRSKPVLRTKRTLARRPAASRAFAGSAHQE